MHVPAGSLKKCFDKRSKLLSKTILASSKSLTQSQGEWSKQENNQYTHQVEQQRNENEKKIEKQKKRTNVNHPVRINVWTYPIKRNSEDENYVNLKA